MELREQKYMLTIAQCKNISLAAEKLHVTQPALSAFLLKLERSLGGQLFVRHNRELELTKIGRLYVEKAEKIMELNREFELAFAQLLQNREIPLKIGVQTLRAPRIIPSLLIAFKEKMPLVRANFVEEKGCALRRMLKEREVDMIISSELWQNQAGQGVESIPIRKDQLILVAPQNDSLVKSKAQIINGIRFIDLADVRSVHFLLVPREHSMRLLIDSLLHRLGIELPDFKEVTRQESGLHLAAFGEGLAFTLDSYLPYFTLPKPVDYYRVKNAPAINYSLMYLKDHFQESFIQSLCAVVRKVFKTTT